MVGLTGGIGAGKTAVSARLAALGALVIDSDVLAREVVAPGTPGLAAVVDAFGAGVLAADGSLDRPALGRLAFADADARRRLEAIIHPRVRARATEIAAGAPAGTIVVHDVPLLVETGLAPTFHLVLVVSAAESVRVDRLVRDRGMSEDEAYARIRAQASDDTRAAAADVVLPNDGSLALLDERVGLLWTERLVGFEENLRLRRAVWPVDPPVVPYDPTWPAQYARLAARLTYATGATGAAGAVVAHVGATAEPGLAAPDIIGIRLEVSTMDGVPSIVDALAAAGFPADGRGRHGAADPGRPVDIQVDVTGGR